MKKKFPLKKINNKLFFLNNDIAEEYNRDFAEAGENENVLFASLILETRKKKRSMSANNYYWGFVNKAISEHLDIEPKTLHYRYLLPWFGKGSIEKENKSKFKILMDENDVQFEVIGQGSSQMNTKEFHDFVERVRKWASGPANPDGIVSKHNGLELYITDPQRADEYYQSHTYKIE